MKILGIITEYNPFHNGHLYHLFKAKEITRADYVVAVMSGNFLQRGEPAIINKWTRTKMALNAGVDLIIELPFVFSTQDANGFAFGAVKLLDSLQITDYLCFGCETDNLDTLCSISNFLHIEPQKYKELIIYNSKNGYEFPRARSQALCEYHRKFGIDGLEKISTLELSKLLKYPNNILALEYIKHLLNLKSKIKPIAIKRMGASYHQKKIKGKISSATSIRNEILNNLSPPKTDLFMLNDKIKSTIPTSGFSVLERELREGRGPITLDSYRQSIFAILRRMSLDDISRIHGVTEGLENRIKKASLKSYTVEQLINSIKTRRYTRTKIQRIILHIMMNLSKEDITIFNKYGPLYARILGFSKKGKTLLRAIKKNSSTPLISKLSNYLRQTIFEENNHVRNRLVKMLDYDILATDIYVLGNKKPEDRVARLDFTHKIVIKKD
ncbi:nucleotidyltransferase [bacterium]|nr:nucleotidyltransferase [bacterium]MBU1428541.1 nucleotidyltransferase [bacterium]MBU2439874.1 nucleotidyltransferase [bacterium]MBU4562979.1 nucleotidyltransferase [bacterium]